MEEMNNTEREQEQFSIYEVNMELLEKKMDKINKKAIKLGCQPMEIKIVRIDHIEYDDKESEFNGKKFDKVFIVELIGTTPKLNGWEFIGNIEKHSGENIVKTVNGMEYPERYKKWDNLCEHCYTNRVRKNYYIVKNIETGLYKAVGKTCLKDFLGHNNPESYAQLLEYCTDTSWLDEFSGIPNGRGDHYIPLEEYLWWVAKNIRKEGWVSRSYAKEAYGCQATADLAINDMYMPYIYRKENFEYPTDKDLDMAKNAIGWAKSFTQEQVETNDYLRNINIIAKEDFTSYKNIGFSASIVSSYMKHLEMEIIKKQKAEYQKKEAESGYIGIVGQKFNGKVTFLNVFSFDGFYGTTYIYKFLDNNGNVIIWKTKYDYSLEQGEVILLKGTIKEHTLYRDVKQTVLTRCRMSDTV